MAPAAVSAITVYANASNNRRMEDKMDTYQLDNSTKMGKLETNVGKSETSVAGLIERRDDVESDVRTIFRDCFKKTGGFGSGTQR